MQLVTNWEKYAPYFTKAEFDCQETGENRMTAEYMDFILEVRIRCGFPMPVSSGFRSLRHSLEVNKPFEGTHPKGIAGDYKCNGQRAFLIVKHALDCGASGVGVSQRKGVGRYVHLDIWDGGPRPNIWGY